MSCGRSSCALQVIVLLFKSNEIDAGAAIDSTRRDSWTAVAPVSIARPFAHTATSTPLTLNCKRSSWTRTTANKGTHEHTAGDAHGTFSPPLEAGHACWQLQQNRTGANVTTRDSQLQQRAQSTQEIAQPQQQLRTRRQTAAGSQA